MRMRNKPWAEDFLKKSDWIVNKPKELKGKWKQEVFNNENPLHLEIGMGKGGFILEHANKTSDINFLGLERFKSIHVYPVKYLEENYNTNEMKHMRQFSHDAMFLEDFFIPGEVDKIYVNFPDPWPKSKHAKRRLIYRDFLERYYNILKPGGTVEFKTDQYVLWEFAKEEVEEHGKFEIYWESNNLHNDAEDVVKTEYETKFSNLGLPINMLIMKKPE